jgi:S-adenosyl methyltransferase
VPAGAAGEQAIKAFPSIVLSARSNRAFLARAVRFLAGEAGIRQFDGLDLVEPGMVQASKWRADSEAEAAGPAALWAGVARKP